MVSKPPVFLNNHQHTFCFHCASECHTPIVADKKKFCCRGCLSVYTLLQQNDLLDFYSLNAGAGNKQQNFQADYRYLDEEEISSEYILYQDSESGTKKVQFQLPDIHCSSCVWLLENLHKINEGIVMVRVNFMLKTAYVTFNSREIKLSELALLLQQIGYSPILMKKKDGSEIKSVKASRSLIIRLGISGFFFGNIMLLSLPEYLDYASFNDTIFSRYFSLLNVLFSIPVALYCAYPFYLGAFQALRRKKFSIDLPIAIGVVAMGFQTIMSLVQKGTMGYADSLAGLVFFLLIGRWFQHIAYTKTWGAGHLEQLLPMAVLKQNKNKDLVLVGINSLQKDDVVLLKSNEVLPSDARLMASKANFDMSFITGESLSVSKKKGDLIYAGARLMDQEAFFVLQSNADQSYLMRLWKDSKKEEVYKISGNIEGVLQKISRIFTTVIVLVAIFSFIFWLWKDSSRALEVMVSVLIIACPCALALSVPFTFGNSRRILNNKGFYMRDAADFEKLAACTHIVFDKTGTLTTSANKVVMQGNCSEEDLQVIFSMTQSSSHPLSNEIHQHLKPNNNGATVHFNQFKEVLGKGILAQWNNNTYVLGSALFVLENDSNTHTGHSQRVYFSKNGTYIGVFSIERKVRAGLGAVLDKLSKSFSLSILSGDNRLDPSLKNLLPPSMEVCLQMLPDQKSKWISNIKELKKGSVVMVGDGMNDLAALSKSDVGMVLVENNFSFVPDTDVLLKANLLFLLPEILRFSKKALLVVKLCVFISFFYNTIGLYFAVSGLLSPLIAAIVMPLSSISVLVTALLGTRIAQRITLKPD